ncbi:MAG: cation:proton antiporter [Desulfuromonas sp.]|nr:cation:proton antiporter [Desulfuromonas sp.]
MDWILEFFQHFPPLARLSLAFFLVLVVPMMCQRFSLPAVVGLLIAGVVIGPYGLKIIPRNPVVGNFLSELGKLMLMMFAGIEIDHALFRRVWKRSLLFGLCTFLLPLLAGVAVGFLFGYYWVAALLIGSLLASHTLLGFPITQQLGIAGSDPVSVTTGATIFTDVASLLILAICLPIHMSGFSPQSLIWQLVLLLGYVPLVIVGIGKLGAWLMPRFSGAADREFGLVLFLMILASFGAELIHLEPIIGAFMVGLAIGPVTRHAKGFEHFEFIGQSFFIPIFFLSIGFHIDLGVFAGTLIDNAPLVVAVVAGLILAKLAAALVTQRMYRFTTLEGLLMWSLSLPQVAATLAAALVAFNTYDKQGQRLIDEPLLNTIIVLMVVTSILGPVLTERFATRISRLDQTERGKVIA